MDRALAWGRTKKLTSGSPHMLLGDASISFIVSCLMKLKAKESQGIGVSHEGMMLWTY